MVGLLEVAPEIEACGDTNSGGLGFKLTVRGEYKTEAVS